MPLPEALQLESPSRSVLETPPPLKLKPTSRILTRLPPRLSLPQALYPSLKEPRERR